MHHWLEEGNLIKATGSLDKNLAEVGARDDEGVVEDVDLAMLEADGLVVPVGHHGLPHSPKRRGVVQCHVARVLKIWIWLRL